MTISVWILGDQLIHNHPALKAAASQVRLDDICVLMVESDARARRQRYHPHKLVLLFSAMRYYAEDLRARAFKVDYRIASDMTSALAEHIKDVQPKSLIMMAASNRRGQQFQQELENQFGIPVTILPNTAFLSNQFDPFPNIEKDTQVRQETFSREMRRHFNILMDDDGEPIGGQWNFDKQNRKKLPVEIDFPEVVRFEPDAITLAVIDLVQQQYSWVSAIGDFDLAVTRENAQKAAKDFFQNRLKYFGTYEDAMTQQQDVLFHAKLSPYLNLGLLDPLDLAKRAEELYQNGEVAINNVEGFIRQVIGWREYMHWQYQRLMPELAEVNHFDMHNALPGFFWTGETEMNCLKHVLQRSLKSGYAHHIERLMLLSNYCLLTGVAPREVLDWFQSVFVDAYDWVMVPNVMGMGLYADGGLVGSKPYIASANYIHKMGDYCQDCRYDYKKRTGEDACPFNFLYWHFLLEHEEKLRENYRMARVLHNLKYLDEVERQAVRKSAEAVL